MWPRSEGFLILFIYFLFGYALMLMICALEFHIRRADDADYSRAVSTRPEMSSRERVSKHI
jgi:hypothetical protein